MKYILHIDTSAEVAAVALAGNGQLLHSKINTEARNHASVLNGFIETVLKEANIGFDQLSAIAVCGGPGSYTGLRIGLSTAKGLCYALDIPLLMQNRLLLMILPDIHENNKECELYTAIFPAREKEYFIASYKKNFETQIAPQHISEDQLISIGNNMDGKSFFVYPDSIQEVLIKNNIHANRIYEGTIDLKHWATYTYEELNCNRIVKIAEAEPFYLKQVYTHTSLKDK